MSTTTGMNSPSTPRYLAIGFFQSVSNMPGTEPCPAEPAVAADAPLDPHQRDADEEERDEVGDHEGAAAVLDGLPREAEEVAETDGVARHGQDQADAGAPGFTGGCGVAHGCSRMRDRDGRGA